VEGTVDQDKSSYSLKGIARCCDYTPGVADAALVVRQQLHVRLAGINCHPHG